MNKRIVNSMKILVGGVFLLFGILTLKFYIGVVFLMVSLIAFTYSSGIEIDFHNKLVRSYTKYLWVVNGNWHPLSLFNRLTVRKSRKGMRQYGGRTHLSASTFKTYYDVLLMPKDSRRGLLLYSSKNKDESLQFAEEWSHKLQLPL